MGASFKLIISAKLPQLRSSGHARFSYFAVSFSSPYVFHLVRPLPRYRLDLNIKNRREHITLITRTNRGGEYI